jgi:hypothetical protein
MMILQQEGVEDFVKLIHSPLRNYVSPNGNHYRYYSCEEKFAALAKSLEGRQTRIMVLVDGPPGSTNPHARYPAMPIILQHMGSHQLDFFMDDYNRKDEKEIVDLWTELLDQRSLAYKKQVFPFEKGACLLSIE